MLHAQHLTVTEVKIGGVPGVQVGYTLTSTTSGTLHAAQLEVLPKPGRACFVTLTAAGPLPNGVFPRPPRPLSSRDVGRPLTRTRRSGRALTAPRQARSVTI